MGNALNCSPARPIKHTTVPCTLIYEPLVAGPTICYILQTIYTCIQTFDFLFVNCKIVKY